MKKYHIADLLTLSEGVLALFLVGLAFFENSSDLALWCFLIAELCDAFDGICARKFHYPNDGKYRWWRVHASFLDQLTDILAGSAALIYISLRVNLKLGLTGFALALVVGLAVQIIAYSKFTRHHPRLKLGLILARRYFYLGGVAAGAIVLLFQTSWTKTVKITILVLGLIVGLILAVVKLNRLTEDKTPV